MRRPWLVLILLCYWGVSCTRNFDKPDFWIYTSLYKDTLSAITPLLEKKFPRVTFQWYQSGSENVAARVNAELSSGRTQADLLITSDPFWYVELRETGHLLNYETKVTRTSHFSEGNGAFVIQRVPVVVMGFNSEAIPKDQAPKSWRDLLDPKWKGKVSMGSPLESGTSFSTVAQLVQRWGWKYFQDLRKNEILSAGGNSAVVSRLETKERPIGIVLLENILEARKRGSPIEAIYPSEGAIVIPGPIAIASATRHPELAKQVYDYFLGPEIQGIIVHRAGMYSPVLVDETPKDALPFPTILTSTFQWGDKKLVELFQQRNDIKKRFTETVLN